MAPALKARIHPGSQTSEHPHQEPLRFLSPGAPNERGLRAYFNYTIKDTYNAIDCAIETPINTTWDLGIYKVFTVKVTISLMPSAATFSF